MHGFDGPSASVSLNERHFPFDARYLWGPAPFGIPALRFFAHEVVHFWQLLGSGFLGNLALSEFRALKAFDADGEAHPSRIAAEFTRVVDAVGFSPYDLHEALCRYWDIHIVGPELLLGEPPPASDAAMTAGDGPPEWMTEGLEETVVTRLRGLVPYSDEQYDRWMAMEDRYARPYRLMSERLGSREAVVLFPLATYFAFQTPKPCEVFEDAVRTLSGGRVVPTGEGRQSIHDMWRHAYGTVRAVVAKAAFVRCGVTLTSGLPVLAALASEGNPVHRHFHALVSMAHQAWDDPDIRFALPGDPECRLQLTAFFLPAVTVFRDGRWAADSPIAKLARASGTPGVLDAEALADASEEIRDKGQAMRKSQLLASLRPS